MKHSFPPAATLLSRTSVPATGQCRSFTLIELLVVIAIIAIVVASKVGFFLQFSAIFAFKALWGTINYNRNMVYSMHFS